MRYRSIGLALTILVLASLPVALASSHQLSSPDATEVPERTVELQGDTYTITSAIQADPGNSISVNIAEPDDVDEVTIHNKKQEREDSVSLNDSRSVSFDLSGYEPGTYAVTTYQFGGFTDVMPILVSGYDVSLNMPDSPTSDAAFDITVDVTQTATDSPPANVQVVIANDETRETPDVSASGDTYTATVEAGTLSSGEYTVYGIAQGDEEAFGQKEILGMSESQTLTIASSSNGGADTESDNGDGSDAEPTKEDTEAETKSPDSNTATGENEANRSDSSETEEETQTNTETATNTVIETPTATETETNDGVISPAEDQTTESTSASGPGFTGTGVIITIALAVLFGRQKP